MKVIEQSVEILDEINEAEMLKRIEKIARICYKSEDKITEDSANSFVKTLIYKGHLSPLEQISFAVKFTTNRGISHELVRHRLASPMQESTRYCKYNKGLIFINPVGFKDLEKLIWSKAMQSAERYYEKMIDTGSSAQAARSVLPTDIKTELVMKTNVRHWREIIRQRTSPEAHPQMIDLMNKLVSQLNFKVLI